MLNVVQRSRTAKQTAYFMKMLIRIVYTYHNGYCTFKKMFLLRVLHLVLFSW